MYSVPFFSFPFRPECSVLLYSVPFFSFPFRPECSVCSVPFRSVPSVPSFSNGPVVSLKPSAKFQDYRTTCSEDEERLFGNGWCWVLPAGGCWKLSSDKREVFFLFIAIYCLISTQTYCNQRFKSVGNEFLVKIFDLCQNKIFVYFPAILPYTVGGVNV